MNKPKLVFQHGRAYEERQPVMLCSFGCSCIWAFEECVRNCERDEIVKKKRGRKWKFAFTVSELDIWFLKM
jgi:hypothetical protein